MNEKVNIVAAFAESSAAIAATGGLRSVAIDPASVTFTDAGAVQVSSEPQREAKFVWHLVLIIVTWSVVGAAIGAAIGVALAAAGVPPRGTFGVILQIIAWGLFFHIMAGLWAGYAVLTQGESRRPVARAADGRVLVSVRCELAQSREVVAALRRAGATSVGTYSGDGTLIA